MKSKLRRRITRMIQRGDYAGLKNTKGDITAQFSSIHPMGFAYPDYLLLHTVRSDTHIEATKLLLHRKANIDMVDASSSYNTPIMIAIFHNAPETVELLSNSGACWHKQNSMSESAITYVTMTYDKYDNNTTFMKIMLRAGITHFRNGEGAAFADVFDFAREYLAQGRENCRRAALALRCCFIRRGVDRSMVDSLLLKQYVLKTLDNPKWLE